MADAQPEQPPGQEPRDEMGEAIFQQARELWIDPEVARRRNAGQLEDGFALAAAQIIFNADTEAPEIRLNDQVRAVLKARAARPIEKGERVTTQDFTEYVDLELTEEDPNAAHLTILRGPRGHWWLTFDFRYNAERIAQTLATAREFLEAATAALGGGHLRAFIDNLFSAAELLAKGVLLTVPDRKLIGDVSHRFIAARHNLWGAKLGNVPRQFVELLNTLTRERPKARYASRPYLLDHTKAETMLATAREMFHYVDERSPKRTPAPA